MAIEDPIGVGGSYRGSYRGGGGVRGVPIGVGGVYSGSYRGEVRDVPIGVGGCYRGFYRGGGGWSVPIGLGVSVVGPIGLGSRLFL